MWYWPFVLKDKPLFVMADGLSNYITFALASHRCRVLMFYKSRSSVTITLDRLVQIVRSFFINLALEISKYNVVLPLILIR